MNKTKSTFEDLVVWKKARELRKEISELTKTFPKEEKYRLFDQMIRASRSVTANIAEGYGRFHFQENIQYCRQARGSLYELLDHFTVVLDEKYISVELHDEYKIKILNLIKILNGYIKYLKDRKTLKI